MDEMFPSQSRVHHWRQANPIGMGSIHNQSRGPTGLNNQRIAEEPQLENPLPYSTAITAKTGAIYSRAIQIFGTPDFIQKTEATLGILHETETGSKSIADIQASGKSVLIVMKLAKDKLGRYAVTKAKNKKNAVIQDPFPYKIIGHPSEWIPNDPGPGSDSVIEWNPYLCDAFTPPELVLGHELLHARRDVLGIQLVGKNGLGQSIEEAAIIGPKFDPPLMTENALREQLNKRPNKTHHYLSSRFY